MIMTIKTRYCLYILFLVVLAGCSDLSSEDIEMILKSEKAYPRTIEMKLFCNNEITAREVTEKNLVRDGYVTAQLSHTPADIGKPLVYFTEQAQPFLIPTDDTLKSFDIQRIKVADEVLKHVRNIEINPQGNKAVVDYTTEFVNLTPFIVLYQDVTGEQQRRTFFTKEGDLWKWDGKVVKMPNK